MNRTIKLLRILLLWYSLFPIAFTEGVMKTQAQETFLFHHLTRNEGLLHDNVTCFAQDSLGFIWMGTHRGLNRYDGYRLEGYKYERDPINSVYYNRVLSLQPIGKHLWIATEAGIACFDIYQKQFVDFSIDCPTETSFFSQVKVLQKGNSNELWLLSENQIYRAKIISDSKTKKLLLKCLPIGEHLSLSTTQLNPQIAVSPNGTVWLSGNPTLTTYRYTQGKDELISSPTPIASGIVKMRYAEGFLWVIYTDRLVKYRYLPNNSYQIVAQKVFDNHKALLSLTVGAHYVWVVNEESVFQLRKEDLSLLKEHTHSPSNPYSAKSHINSVFLDKDSNLWLSAWSDGVSYTSTREAFFKTVWINPQSRIGSEFVSTMHYDPDGYVYIGNKFGGVIRFNTRLQQLEAPYCDAPELSPNVTSIESDPTHLYVSVRERVYIINKQQRRIVGSFQAQCKDYIFDLKLDAYHRLWITTYSGLECFTLKNGTWQPLYALSAHTAEPLQLSTNKLHKIYVDSTNNELVITSVMGLNRLQLDREGRVVRVLKYIARGGAAHQLSSNYIWAIDKKDDTYWIGTMGSGLNRVVFTDNTHPTYTAEHYGIAEGASSNDVESVEVDAYGNVWCGGFYLSYFDTKLKRFATFGKEDGLQGHSFGTASSCKDTQGNLYFGGSHGFNYFHPKYLKPIHNQLKVYFSSYANNGKTVASAIEYRNQLKVQYPNNNLTVYFSTLSYSAPQHLRYRYKLEDYDTNWHYIASNTPAPQATYHKLPYGTYKLIVEVGDWQQWSGNQSVLTIVSTPPFYLSWWAYTIYATVLAALLYLSFRYFIRWTQMKHTIAVQEEKERHKEELMQMKMQFFTDVSHEFRTPLTIMSHAVTEIEEEMPTNKYVHTLKRNTGKLSNMVNELLEMHRMDVYTPQLRANYISVNSYVQSIYNEFKEWAKQVTIRLQLTLPEQEVKLWLDEKYFSKILSNILSNAIRYSNAGSSIRISVSVGNLNELSPLYRNAFENTTYTLAGKQLIVKVQDEGVGLEKEALPKIFERFHRVEGLGQKRVGSGIGLSLVKSLVEAHRGGIIISSKPNVGTEVIITFSMNDSYLLPEQKLQDSTFHLKEYLSDYAVEYEHIGEDEEEILNLPQEDKPTLLLVDDNHEVLMILKNIFIKEYNIILASDGEQAIEKCNQHFPNLVISDVMMPKIDGFELCAILKKNLQTCFIPVILLTAKSQIESQIEGIELGADAYLTKPFDVKLLKTNVRNLLNKSKQHAPIENIRQKVIDKKQQELLDKLTHLVVTNMQNPHFSVDNLCLELGMNRTKLYSFAKQATELTLANYIRKIRLDKAAELLKTTDKLISEVCYEVGIDSPSYFTRAFKEQFGVSPSEYISGKR
jgi:histidine kinase